MNLDDVLKSIREESDSKRAKIDSGKFLTTKTYTNPLKGQRFQAPGLPSAPPVVVKIDPKKIIPDNTNIISDELNDKLDELIQVIREDNKLERAEQKQDKRELEDEKRKDREERIETKKETKFLAINIKKKTGKIADFFSKFLKFLKLGLLGGIVNSLFNFLIDPENREKIIATQKFLKEYWPVVLGALAYFFTPFGKLANFIIGVTGKFLIKLGMLAAKNPILAAALGVGVSAEILRRRTKSGAEQIIEREEEEAGREFTPEEAADELSKPFNLLELFTRLLLPSLNKPVEGRSGGGLSMGTDIVPAMLTPGEFIMSRGAVNMFGADTMMAMNKMGGGTNRPKFGKVMGFSEGGKVGSKGPVISQADYASLLAISSVEDDDPQGRADVAQSIYNRLFSANNYGTNYNQRANNIKSLIIAPDQYAPVFGNPGDWAAIQDLESAAVAVMNSKKVSYDTAMKMLLDTDKALSNSSLQMKAAEHVGGRTFFLGKSQQSYMQSDKGDVLRNKDDNFFSMWYQQGQKYDRERRDISADIPRRFQSVVQPTIPKTSIDSSTFKSGTEMFGPAFADDRTAYIEGARKELGKLGRFLFDATGARSLFHMIKNKLPVETPNVPTETRNFTLPPVETPKKSQNVSKGNEVPNFSVVSGNQMRDLISKDLGISDLAGVS
tara:strand:+ start:5491 stop:7494 length:2004 start_codon:yes stop_codon:yes gene_type:complete